MTLEEAQDYVEKGRVSGVRCPCCGLFNKTYTRRINSGQALSLLIFYQLTSGDWLKWWLLRDVQDVRFHKNREFGKLRYWHLVENHPEDPQLWRLTRLGRQFAEGRVQVSKYATIFDGECLELSEEGTSITDCLRSQFDYKELMDGKGS